MGMFDGLLGKLTAAEKNVVQGLSFSKQPVNHILREMHDRENELNGTSTKFPVTYETPSYSADTFAKAAAVMPSIARKWDLAITPDTIKRSFSMLDVDYNTLKSKIKNMEESARKAR